MKTIAIAIQKGGTGKTTTAAVLAQAAHYKGKKVLAIDLDPQGNLSFALNAKITQSNSFDLLNNTPFNKVVQTLKPGFDVISASMNLATEASKKGSATRLKKALEPIKKNYDLIIIDTPATVGELQYNALCAADELVIPLEADTYSLQSLYQIVNTANATNKNLLIRGFIITKLDNRSTIAKQMQENIIVAANKKKISYLGSIRTGVALKEAAAMQISLYEHEPNSKPAQDYLSVLEQIL